MSGAASNISPPRDNKIESLADNVASYFSIMLSNLVVSHHCSSQVDRLTLTLLLITYADRQNEGIKFLPVGQSRKS